MITTITTIVIVFLLFFVVGIVGNKKLLEMQNIKSLAHMEKARLHIAQEQLKRRLEDIAEGKS